MSVGHDVEVALRDQSGRSRRHRVQPPQPVNLLVRENPSAPVGMNRYTPSGLVDRLPDALDAANVTRDPVRDVGGITESLV